MLLELQRDRNPLRLLHKLRKWLPLQRKQLPRKLLQRLLRQPRAKRLRLLPKQLPK